MTPERYIGPLKFSGIRPLSWFTIPIFHDYCCMCKRNKQRKTLSMQTDEKSTKLLFLWSCLSKGRYDIKIVHHHIGPPSIIVTTQSSPNTEQTSPFSFLPFIQLRSPHCLWAARTVTEMPSDVCSRLHVFFLNIEYPIEVRNRIS